MKPLRAAHRQIFLVAILSVGGMFSVQLGLQAKDFPSDVCSMLPAAQLSKVLGQPFSAPEKTMALAAPQDRVSGTDCTYRGESGAVRKLLFRMYVDPSASVAKDTFDKLSAYFRPNQPIAGNWDTGYVDGKHAIHIQKGVARFYLQVDPVGADTGKVEKQLKDLSAWVAGQI